MNKEIESKTNLVVQHVLNFDNDIKALLFIINHEQAKIKATSDSVSDIQRIFSEDLTLSNAAKSAETIYAMLSTKYKEILSYYFNEEGLIKFISEYILLHVYKVNLGKNMATIKGNNSIDISNSNKRAKDHLESGISTDKDIS